MSLLVKALRQLDARQQNSAPAVEGVAETAVMEETAAEAAVLEAVLETRSSMPEGLRSVDDYYPDPAAVLSALESAVEIEETDAAETIPAEILPVEPETQIGVEESSLGFDSASEFSFDSTSDSDLQIALLESAVVPLADAEPITPAIDIAPTTSESPIPLTPDSAYSLPNLELAASYPTLAETGSEIAAEEFPVITTPTPESLLTEIDLTEATVVPPSERVEKQIETALDRLDELRALISAGDTSPAPIAEDGPQLLPISTTPTKAFQIREEFRELRDHLLARYTLPRGAALLFVDAGRQTSDTSWLFPLAASLLQYFADSPNPDFTGRSPRILLIEAAGPACGLASSLGLQAVAGLSDILQCGKSWNSAVLSTWHPQISMLGGGTEPLVGEQDRLPALFKELAETFDVLLIAAGPWITGAHVPASLSEEARPIPSTASLLAGCAGAAVLCVELDGTPLPIAEAVKRNLAASDMNLLGCVVRGDLTAA